MKGDLEGLVAVVASWLSGYGSYSQTPWVRISQLPVFFLVSFLPKQVEFQRNNLYDSKICNKFIFLKHYPNILTYVRMCVRTYVLYDTHEVCVEVCMYNMIAFTVQY